MPPPSPAVRRPEPASTHIGWRLLALCLDTALVTAPLAAGVLVAMQVGVLPSLGEPAHTFVLLANLVVVGLALSIPVFGTVAYHVVSLRVWGATAGKRAVGLQVRTADGNRPSWAQAFGRTAVLGLLGPLVVFGVLASNDRRCLHDRASNLQVHRTSN